MTIHELKKGDTLICHGVPAHFEVVKVNRVTIRVRNTVSGAELSVYPHLFDRKVEEASHG